MLRTVDVLRVAAGRGRTVHAGPWGRPMSDAPIDVHELAGQLLEKAGAENSGRAGRTLPHPVDGLRQTLVPLRGGAEPDEHESPTRTASSCSASPSPTAAPTAD